LLNEKHFYSSITSALRVLRNHERSHSPDKRGAADGRDAKVKRGIHLEYETLSEHHQTFHHSHPKYSQPPWNMAGTRKAIVVGISGCSSSGKTTISRLLRDIFPNTFVLHEDDFYRPENE